MTKQIELLSNSNIGSLIDSEPFFLVDGENLIIEFIEVERFPLLLTIKNGDLQRQLLISQNNFMIPKDFILEGELQMIVSAYNGTSITNKWICEPIILFKPKPDVFEVSPKIRALENRIAELESEVHILQDNVFDLQQQVVRIYQIEES